MELDEADDQRQIDDYIVSKHILLRNYQLSLLEKAKKQNSIIYLPTGTGKTLIAIHVLCSRSSEIKRPFSAKGKIAVFLATTKVMVHQMAAVLRSNTKFDVIALTGEMNVDCWKINQWMEIFEKCNVLVLTGEILKVILQLKYISPSNISLLVLDECHHAMYDHPYSLVMKIMRESGEFQAPLILGLTGVLLNATPKKSQVQGLIRNLESTMNGIVITEPLIEEVMSFSANPTDKIIVFKEDPVTPAAENIQEMYTNLIETVKKMDVKSGNSPMIPEGASFFHIKNKAKRVKNLIVNSQIIFEELGFFCGSLGALFHIIALEKVKLMTTDSVEIQMILFAKTELLKIRRAFQKHIGEEESVDAIIRFSNDKVRQLIKILKEFNETECRKSFSILIFTRRRVTAIILAFLLKRLKAIGNEFSFLKPEFVVSSGNTPDSVPLEIKNEEIVKKFKSQFFNVLVATDVLEEGIDVSSCNVVISFDFPLGYPSYFQSRGRARNKESTYYMFVQESETKEKKNSVAYFKSVENEILQSLSHEYNLTENDESSEEDVEKIQLYGKHTMLSIDGITAITIINRYCSKLPQDKYSFLSPASWYIDDGKGKKGFIQLPTNCPVRQVIEGEPRDTVKKAKRSCFLVAVKVLFNLDEFDDEMNPKSLSYKEEDFKEFFPHYKAEEIEKSLPQPGTRKRKQKYNMKFAESLSGCLPSPNAKAYLHVINLTIAFDKPSLERRVAIYESLQFPATFALITSKKLCKILRFPLFLDIGQINCELLVNYDELILTEDELNDIKLCHFTLFQKVTKVLKNSQVFDNRNKEHSFFVVPVEKNIEDRFVLNWNIIKCDYCKGSTSALVRYKPLSVGIKTPISSIYNGERDNKEDTCSSLVSMDSIKGQMLWAFNQGNDNSQEPKFVMTETDYKYFVIFPNYRNQEFPQRYIVDKFCFDMSPLSPFPRTKYEDYIAYYKDNYMIEITNEKQPLLKVSPIFNCSNFNRPSTRNLGKERLTSYTEYLVPELCDVIPFDRNYYLKALLLPTILNRICHVYCVEEFRRKLVLEMGLGKCDLSEGMEWAPLESVAILTENEESEDGNNPKSLQSLLPLAKLKNEMHTNRKDFLDPERHLYEIGLCDVEFYVNNVLNLTSVEEFDIAKQLKVNDEIEKLAALRNTPIPPLSCCKSSNIYSTNSGPELALLIQKNSSYIFCVLDPKMGIECGHSMEHVEVLKNFTQKFCLQLKVNFEACTSKSANDLVDYERLEILGDSFLKFATSTFLFRNINGNEGLLTVLKGKLVGNRNLFNCGLSKGFTDIINVSDFAPLCDWNPPLIYIPERLMNEIITRNLDPAVIYRFNIPLQEQLSGILSEDTFQKVEEVFEDCEKCYDLSSNSLLPHKIVADKTVSDCIEAFIGAYLLSFGVRGGCSFLSWLGVLPSSENSYSELLEKPYDYPVHHNNCAVVMDLLNEVFYSDLEKTLNYSFKNKALLLEAITHPSFSRNRITDCYQRLEFLGDAVLEFLITSYVYEYFGNLNPGQVTDIRSFLLNNITFSCLTVRYDLHKYLLYCSSPLTKAIQTFVNFQENRNHVIDDNILILVEKNDCSIAETLTAPKCLGDIFEALAGAIFLDSGNSLQTVWEVFYILMKREIDEVTKNIPKNPVRLLHEICGDKPYFESKVIDNNTTMVLCSIYYEGEEVKGYGCGQNKKEAKQSAAKIILNKIIALKK